MGKRTLTFRVHTPLLLKEITECAIDKNTGVLKVPLNQFRILLLQVAERASQLNDAKLNKLMCDLTLYDEADPESENYNPELLEEVERLAKI